MWTPRRRRLAGRQHLHTNAHTHTLACRRLRLPDGHVASGVVTQPLYVAPAEMVFWVMLTNGRKVYVLGPGSEYVLP